LERSLLPIGFGSYFGDVAIIDMVRVGFRCDPAGLSEPYFGKIALVEINLDLKILRVGYGQQRSAGPLVASKALGRDELVFVSQFLEDDTVDRRANNCPSQLPAS
jgi:hypothetical protein